MVPFAELEALVADLVAFDALAKRGLSSAA
jgi:hypothetical protein